MGETLREQLLPWAQGTQRACIRKKRYVSQKHANGTIKLRTEAGETATLYSYHCTHCEGWHITKMRPPSETTHCSTKGEINGQR